MSRTPPAWPRPDGGGAASAPTNWSPSGPPSRVGARPQRARVRRPSSAPPWGQSTGHRRTAASQAARATAPEARGAARSARCRSADASHPGPRGHVRCSGPAVAQSSVARSSSPRRHPRWCDPALTTRSPERASSRSDPGPTGASLPDRPRSDDQQPAPWLASAPHGAPAYPLFNNPGILNPSPSPGPRITVDRAHVLASSFMDRHAASVGLTRHREGVELHWAREDLRDRAGLERVLSRERAKDTTLDYAAGFAERRRFVPRSEILVERAPSHEVTPPSSTAQRSPFAGLKLGAERAVRPGAFAGLKLPIERAPMPDPSAALSRMQLEMAAAIYAKAWGDAEATRARGHTPLPHQTVALERAGAALEQLRPEGMRDLGQARARDPELAARGVRDRVELVAAMTHESRWRTEPGYRAEHYEQAWHALERDYAAAHRPVERAAVRGRMETFVDRLERDPEGERQLLAREAGWVRARGDEPAPPLRELVAERERARAWEEERARVLIRKRSRGLSL